jgi:flavin reductase (DIM6/NTAB) family NADH-FMN oxidoreductase RutF
VNDVTRRFNQLMAGLDHPMIIVTTAAGGVRAGCLVGFHAQGGIDPPEYAVWLSKANHTYRVGALAEAFAVHFPSSDQRDLAELFGGSSGDDVDKFERCRWTSGPDGVPLLDDCPNRFVGRRTAWLDAGSDHVCLMLRPQQAEVGPEGIDHLLWLGEVLGIEAGHGAEERQRPRTVDAADR